MRVEQLGKYQLVQHLASGGMASVYLARVTGPGGFERHIVLKTLRAEGAADPSLVPMFLDEARLAASLHHRNIAQVFDVGIDNGTYFLAMEYVTPVRVEWSVGECERPVRVECSAAERELPPEVNVSPTLPHAMPRARGWVWAVVTGTLLAAGTFAWIVILPPAEPATVPHASSEPAAPIRTSPPAAAPARPSPAPVAAPAASTEITLHVTTEPVGATVVLEGVRLGTTPFTARMPFRSKPAWLKVRRRGSVATKTQVVLDRDVTWFVRLRAARSAERALRDLPGEVDQ